MSRNEKICEDNIDDFHKMWYNISVLIADISYQFLIEMGIY